MGNPDRSELAAEAARTFDPSTQEFLEHEFETYSLLREELPIAQVGASFGGAPGASESGENWLLTRYDDACACLSDTDQFSSQSVQYPVRPWIPQAIDPPAHTSYRRIMNKWFTPDAMTAMEPHLNEFAEELVDKMLEKDEFDFVADFADPFPAIIFCELIGFPTEDYRLLMDWKNTLMHSGAGHGHKRGKELAAAKAVDLGLDVEADGSLSPDVQGQVYGSVAFGLYEYFGKLLETRRQEPQDDLISHLIAETYEGDDGDLPLTNDELLDTMFLFFMAGLDTVASVFGLVVKHFAEDPAKRREFIELMDDPERLMPAIEELVRVHSIVLLPRRVTGDMEFNGHQFSEEDRVVCPTQACNRDPEQFDNPDEVIYDRVPNRHMGFGHGPHRCLGIHLARRELRIGLVVLLRKMSDYRLHPDKPPQLFGGMKGASELWLTTSE